MNRISNKVKKVVTGVISAISATAIAATPGMSVFAANKDDVAEAAKNAGVPDVYINQGLYNNDKTYTDAQYNAMLDQISKYTQTVNTYLAKYFGGKAENYSVKNGRETDNEFVKGNMAEKQSYVQAMSKSKREKFIETMTKDERNSAVKLFTTQELTEILTPLVDFAKTLGFNISIDSIVDGVISMSIRDDDGTLLDVSRIGTTVDDVGYDYKLPVMIGIAAIISSVLGFGIVYNIIRRGRREVA